MATLEEFRKFSNNEPEAQREIRTIEVYHPALDRVYRFARNYTDINLTLESNAPRDAGQTVTFEGVSIQIDEPSSRSDAEAILNISMGAVDDRLQDIINQLTGGAYLIPTQIIYRKYYDQNTSQPAVPPLYLEASTVNFENSEVATVSAEDSDLANKRAGIIYTTTLFRGLEK